MADPDPCHNPLDDTRPLVAKSHPERFSAARIAGISLIVGFLWIGITDLLPAGLGAFHDRSLLLAAGKQAVYVLLSSSLLFWLWQREPRTGARATARQQAAVHGDGPLLSAIALYREAVSPGNGSVSMAPASTEAKPVEHNHPGRESEYRDLANPLIRADQDVIAQRVADVAARASEKRLQAAIEFAGLGIIVVDYERQSAELSSHAAEQFGFQPGSSVTGAELHARFHPADQAELEQLMASAQCPAGTGSFDLEHRVCRPDGTIRWVNVRKQVSFLKGRPHRAVVVTADTTDRRLAEDSLRRSEERYRLLFEANPHPMWVYDVDSLRFLAVNDAAILSYGYSRDEFLNLTIRDIRPAEDVPRLESVVAQLASGPTRPSKWRHRRKDGTLFDVEISSHDLSKGVGSSRLVAALDVTERLRAEEALRASERRLRLALEPAGTIAFVWDITRDTLTRYYSTEPALPITAERVVALAEVRSQIHPDDRPGFDARLAACLAEGTEYRNEYRLVRPEGTTVCLEEYGYLDRAADGTPLRLTGMSIDVTARVTAGEALRGSEERLREAARVAGFGVFEHDHVKDLVFWSARLREIYGFDPDAVPDLQAYLDMVHPADREFIATAVRRAHDPNGDGRFDVEHRLIRPADGRIRWLTTKSQTRFTGEGPTRHPLITVGATVDVTDAREAAEALRESEGRFRQLVDLLPDSLFVDVGGKITYCNPAFVRLMGAANAAELLGLSPFDVAHPDCHEGIRARAGEALVKGSLSVGTEMRIVRRDGRAVPVYAVSTDIIESGQRAVLVVLSDLTERERATELLRSVLDSVNDVIMTIDERGIIRSANPAIVRQFGYRVDDVVGLNINTLIPKLFGEESDDYLVNSLSQGAVKVVGVGREVEARCRNGTCFPAELTISEFQLDVGRHFTGVLRDITERKRLEAQFLQAQKMEAVGRLAGGVAHDFNNLLTVINGYSNLLLAGLPMGDSAREPLAEVCDAGERAARLTQQLLAFSRKSVISPRLVDLNELVAESAKMLRRLIGEDVTLLFLPDPVPVRTVIDPGQLEQVLMNLAVNARDAMPTGGRLTIETRGLELRSEDVPSHTDLPPGRYVTLRVADTGCGMTADIQDKIFEPFFTTKGIGKGTGLGLAVAHGVIKQAGGSITVESAVGTGTTFTVLLLAAGAEQAEGTTSGIIRVAPRGTETVLLVEDEDAVRTLVRVTLEGQGYKVFPAAGGEQALELLKTHQGRIHLLVTDVIMPGMSGPELADVARMSRPGLRVLYMSGYTDDALGRHGLEGTAVRFIQKPFTPLVLARSVRAILD